MVAVIAPEEKSKLIKRLAAAVGFDLCGVAAAAPVSRADYVRHWLASGRAGTMAYLHRYVDQRLDPAKLLPEARSVIVVALNYRQDHPAALTDSPTPADSSKPDCRSGTARQDHVPSAIVGQSPTYAGQLEGRGPSGETSSDRLVVGQSPTYTTANRSEPDCRSGTARQDNCADGPRGRVAMYAWGNDYHKVVKKKLFALADQLRAAIDEPFEAKACVDTAPLLEREAAAAAGIGWIGKNTLVLNDALGSYFFLGAIVTTLALAHDEPGKDHCGSCTACLEACPTQAFPAPYEMDASRCISYLTIEHREPIDPAFHSAMGDWVFGCDVCQAVCPHNRKAPLTAEPGFAIREPGPRPRLSQLLNWSEDEYRDKLRGSAIKRAKYDMLRRNAQIAASHANQSG